MAMLFAASIQNNNGTIIFVGAEMKKEMLQESKICKKEMGIDYACLESLAN